MNIRIAAVAALLSLAGAGEAWADDWRIVSASREEFLAIDASTIERSGGRTLYWSLSLYRVTQSDGVDYYMNRGAIDCDAMTIELLTELQYNASHVVIANYTPNAGPSPIPPSSVGATLYRTLCHGQWEDPGRGISTVSQLVTEGRPALERMPVR